MSEDKKDKVEEVEQETGVEETSEVDEPLQEEDEAKEGEAKGEEKVGEAKSEEPAQKQEDVDWKDKYLRLHADWENYRRRMDDQRADERVRANEKLIGELLPVLDDMHHALDYADKNGEEKLLDGFKQIFAKFSSSLEKHGLEEINPVGEPFDPIYHQAVGTVEDDSVFDETVKDVYQKGYKLGKKVLRAAMVTYSTGGAKRPVEKPVENMDAQQDVADEADANEASDE